MGHGEDDPTQQAVKRNMDKNTHEEGEALEAGGQDFQSLGTVGIGLPQNQQVVEQQEEARHSLGKNMEWQGVGAGSPEGRRSAGSLIEEDNRHIRTWKYCYLAGT